jgi:uncharacterized protein (TIGR02996 family)
VDPDDLSGHRAYADWLSEQPDPADAARGEFIQLQLALEDPAVGRRRKALQAREAALLQAHARAWLGKLAPFLLDQKGFRPVFWKPDEPGYRFTFARGWLAEVNARAVTDSFTFALARAPAARLLRALVIEDIDIHEGSKDQEHPDERQVGTKVLRRLRKAPFLPHLRVFQLGGRSRNCHVSGAAVVELVKHLAALEELRLEANDVDNRKLFRLKLPRLRELRIWHLHDYPLWLLAENPTLGNLTRLELHPHAIELGHRGAYLPIAHLRSLARSPHLQALRHLQFRMSNMADEGVKELIDSGLLGRLKSLDLCYGRITDAGARLLAERAEVRSLERLNLTGNCLTAEGIALLQATGVPLEAGGQYVPGTPAYENEEYLFQGDME